MARAMLVHERTPAGGWKPTGVFVGTVNRLDYRMLPGNAARDRWAAELAANSVPPYRDGVGISGERGTWEDWIGWAIGAYSNGHDRWCTEVEPRITAEATYQLWVLEAEPEMTPREFRTTDEIPPDLGGYKKVRPV